MGVHTYTYRCKSACFKCWRPFYLNAWIKSSVCVGDTLLYVSVFLFSALRPPLLQPNVTILASNLSVQVNVWVKATFYDGANFTDLRFRSEGLGPRETLGYYNRDGILISWAPRSQYTTQTTITVTVTDSRDQSTTLIIPLAVCNCNGKCGPLPKVPSQPFTQLPCTLCDPGELLYMLWMRFYRNCLMRLAL